MARTVNDIVLDALRVIGEYAVNEPPDTVYINEGISVVNLILDSFSTSGFYIPFVKTIVFPTEASKKQYTVSNLPGITADVNAPPLVELDSAFTVDSGVTYPLDITSYTEYDDVGRTENFQSRPQQIIWQRSEQQTLITFFPVPDKVYSITMRGKFKLDTLTSQQEMSNVPLGYHLFLTMLLGKHLSMRFPTATWDEKSESILKEAYRSATGANDIDLTITTSSILNSYSDMYDLSSIYRGF